MKRRTEVGYMDSLRGIQEYAKEILESDAQDDTQAMWKLADQVASEEVWRVLGCVSRGRPQYSGLAQEFMREVIVHAIWEIEDNAYLDQQMEIPGEQIRFSDETKRRIQIFSVLIALMARELSEATILTHHTFAEQEG